MTETHEKNPLFARAPEVAAQIVYAIDRGRSEAYVPRSRCHAILETKCTARESFRLSAPSCVLKPRRMPRPGVRRGRP